MNKKNKQRKSEKKTKILIVDDHSIVRHGLTQLINQELDLFVCAEAESAEQALDIIEQQNVDSAILDISLEGMNGIQLTKKIKSRYPHLPILILTMHTEPTYAKRAFQAGARGYITKHEAAETIIAAIRLMLCGKDYISETMTQKFLNRIHSKGSHG